MDIAHLRYFLALCDEMNYTAAAQRCFITRQAMRQAVARLESAYGTPLIVNEHNHLALTPAAKLLFSHAKPLVAQYDRMETAIRESLAPRTPLRVGLSRSLVPFYAPEIVAALDHFPDVYPGVSVDTRLMTADEVLDALACGELDAGLVVDSGALPLPLHRTVLRTDALRIILSCEHPYATRENLRLADLDGLPLMLMSDPSICFKTLYDALAHHRVQVDYRVVTEFYDVGCLIRDNRSVAIDRSEVSTMPLIGQDRLLTLEEDAFSLCCCFVTPASKEAPCAALLRAHLMQ